MPSKTPNEVAYVFGGQVNLAHVRVFFNRHNRLLTKEEYAAWEKDSMQTCVRAIADPRSDVARLCGVMFVGFHKHHLRIGHVLVTPKLRRKRIATNMFYNLVLDPRAQQYQTISAFCPDNCDEGIAWLKSCNFKAISVIPGKDNERDQYLFSWSFQNLVATVGEENAINFGADSGVTGESGVIPFAEPVDPGPGSDS